MKVVIAGGGTAGHVTPAIAIADRLREDGASVRFVGSPDGQEAELVPAAGYPFHGVAARPFRREWSLRSAAAPFVALRSVATCRPLVRGANVVLGVGGYASVPAVLAARSVGRPIVLHEQNAVPGLATRVLARVATAAAVSFPATPLPVGLRVEVTGTPVRREIVAVPGRRAALAAEARSLFGLEEGRTTVLVTGGSLGALHLDRAIAQALPLLAGRADLQLLVLTGRAHEDVVTSAIAEDREPLVRTAAFLERMDLALALADLAVSRAGANTIHELAVCGVPSILVPYPHATGGHQERNARALEGAGAAEVCLDAALTADVLAGRILALVDEPATRRSMSAAATAWAKPDADRRVAALVTNVARTKATR
ncbi:MAG TPA: undecaprenyldiphospho-muramoylpentapeptide beta-N-acetylglucosaminyltransferase [Actinomycetota bacterium]|nr:undecaprenyldiphospho-muramoylpentapeptide beta-N-acetylglucosaminyltransferase [Actinomycetota bacterium]